MTSPARQSAQGRMLEIASEPAEAALAFLNEQWPHHNRVAGINWKVNRLAFLAKQGDQTVGAVAGHIIGGAAVLEHLLVVRELMKNGIGSALFSAFESKARDERCHVIELETAEYQARPFYERRGFTVVGEKRNNKFGATWYVMQKPLLPE